jgi:hypothetical protein
MRVYHDESTWMERVVRIAWQDTSVVSVYVAQSEFSGGASANNSLTCRSYDILRGHLLHLQDVLAKRSVELLLAKARGLLDANVAIDELGKPLEANGFEFNEQGFRMDRSTHYHGTHPEIVLCGESPYPSEAGSIVELRIEAIPVGYLMR